MSKTNDSLKQDSGYGRLIIEHSMTDLTSTEIAWLAGILEGEACFDHYTNNHGITTPRMRLEMKDKDIVERVRKLIQGKIGGIGTLREIIRENPNHNNTYQYSVGGKPELRILLPLIYPYMGVRRRSVIEKMMETLGSLT